MTLVDRPDSWADRICTVTGIDYDRIRDFRDPDYQDYSDQFIGDYVTLLENFIESYRIDFPFQDGRDTAVISLRDDIDDVRIPCALPVNNVLLATDALDAEVVGTDGAALWQPAGCAEPTPGAEGCIARRRLSLELAELPFADWEGGFDDARAFEITFAPEGGPGTSTLFTPDSTLVQVTPPLDPGRYRVSWYGRTPDLAGALEVRGASLTASSVAAEPTTTGWTRYHFIFDVPRAQALTVHWVPPDPFATTPQAYVVAAPMLESLGDAVDGPSAAALTPASHPPTPYAGTDEFGLHVVAACEDTTGVEFRRSEWRRRCQELCTEGYDRSCEAGVTYCYYETTFTVEPEAIASGRFLRRAGFPRGNFNYRIESIGVNFPGTASRVCEGSGHPSTCYSNGSIPYSILHVGSHAVINHLGQSDYLAPIFPGRLEDARGLASERYLTNPLSSADRTLMQDYMNRELRGRPLPGQYVIRVWDAPGVNFEGIEDVQIVLDYRYWTRQE
ncbi:MAG TPA: hypothetical protein ENK57_22515 [Polyangiaceae bacterium]|nr:hypothetical protein [Polyangiaceae bacterium]